MSFGLTCTPDWFGEVAVTEGISNAHQQADFESSIETISWRGSELRAVAGEWIVQLTEDAFNGFDTPAAAATVFLGNEVGLQVQRGLGRIGQLVVKTSTSVAADVISWMEASPLVEYFEPNGIVSAASTTPNDPDFTELWDRVINLRLKSNAIYWLEENAEAMFAIRALLLCDRWDETLGRVRKTMARDRRIDWQWRAPDLTKLKADESISPPSQKAQEIQQVYALAT